MTLHIGEEQVGEGTIRTQPGEVRARRRRARRRAVGRRAGQPTTTPATAPWAFAGGTVKRVVIDVSGEPFVDLAQEARAAFAQQ